MCEFLPTPLSGEDYCSSAFLINSGGKDFTVL